MTGPNGQCAIQHVIVTEQDFVTILNLKVGEEIVMVTEVKPRSALITTVVMVRS